MCHHAAPSNQDRGRAGSTAETETRGPCAAVEVGFIAEFGQLARSRSWPRVAAAAGTLAACLSVRLLLRQPQESLHVASKVPRLTLIWNPWRAGYSSPCSRTCAGSASDSSQAAYKCFPVTDFVAVPFAAALDNGRAGAVASYPYARARSPHGDFHSGPEIPSVKSTQM